MRHLAIAHASVQGFRRSVVVTLCCTGMVLKTRKVSRHFRRSRSRAVGEGYAYRIWLAFSCTFVLDRQLRLELPLRASRSTLALWLGQQVLPWLRRRVDLCCVGTSWFCWLLLAIETWDRQSQLMRDKRTDPIVWPKRLFKSGLLQSLIRGHYRARIFPMYF
jgi:hypothetical protein